MPEPCPPAELQSSLMRLAIDAITQAEGAAPAAVSAPASPALPQTGFLHSKSVKHPC